MRTFFLEHFSPYRVAAADGADMGLVTGYYEPLLTGSRTRTDQFAIALYAQPDDLLTVDLSSLFPELKGKRVRGRFHLADFREKEPGAWRYTIDTLIEIEGEAKPALSCQWLSIAYAAR
mgnify:CR=1 FL=1